MTLNVVVVLSFIKDSKKQNKYFGIIKVGLYLQVGFSYFIFHRLVYFLCTTNKFIIILFSLLLL